MSDLPKVCPVCGKTYEWYEAECPVDHVPLVVRPGPAPDPDVALVAVFRTTEPGLLPLAKMALEQEEIEYDVRDAGLNDQLVGYRQASGSSTIDIPLEILVRTEDAGRARELLSDLGDSLTAAVAQPPASVIGAPANEHDPVLSLSVNLVDDDSGQQVGRITDAQLAWLADRLEQESANDHDYYIDRATLEMLADLGLSADVSLTEILNRALGDREGVTIRWSRD